MNCDILELVTQQILNHVTIIELEAPQHNIKTHYSIHVLGKKYPESHVTSHVTQ